MMKHLKYSDKNLGKAAAMLPMFLTLAVVFGFAVFFFITDSMHFGSMTPTVLATIGLINLVLSYLVSGFLALPLLLVVKRFWRVFWFSILIVAILSGFIASLIFNSFNYRSWNEMNTLGIAVGLTGGVIYCFILEYLHVFSKGSDPMSVSQDM